MQVPGFSVSTNLFSYSLGAKGDHCIEEVTSSAQLLNPALKMFADLVRKETKAENQNCRESIVFFIYGFYDFNL